MRLRARALALLIPVGMLTGCSSGVGTSGTAQLFEQDAISTYGGQVVHHDAPSCKRLSPDRYGCEVLLVKFGVVTVVVGYANKVGDNIKTSMRSR